MSGRRAYPRLPVLGWSAYSGARAAQVPGVLDARYRRHTISGRAALALCLQVLGIGAGARVLVPTYHCPTMISPVVQAGAEPLFYPVTTRGEADLEWLQHADLAGARALLVAHYFGLPRSLANERAFCDRHGMALIEDCAHAFFGAAGERAVGGWGDVAIASLTKFFPVPEGGLILSATRELTGLELAPRRWRDEVKATADAVELGVTHGSFTGLNAVLGGLFAMKNQLRHGTAGEPPAAVGGCTADISVMLADPLLAKERVTRAAQRIADGVHQLRIVEARRRNYADLARHLADADGARPLCAELPPTAVPYVFPLYVDDPEAAYQSLRAAGVPIFRWDVIWPGTPTLSGDHGTAWARHVFQLGCHQDLARADIEAIAATVRDIVRRSGP